MYNKEGMQPEFGPGDTGTQIRITFRTRKRLVDIGRKNESYDACINRIVDEHGWMRDLLTKEQCQLLLGRKSGDP
jgi:hypothetical protein